MELELAVLLALVILGTSIFGAFEQETKRWRRLLKWSILTGVTLALHTRFGHASLAFPLAVGVFGMSVHLWWCRRNGIHPLYATPRRRYFALRGWTWPDDDPA